MCCFLDNKGTVGNELLNDIVLFRAAAKGKESSSIIKLIEEEEIIVFDLFKKCEYLKLNYEVKENFLIISSNCSIYEQRPVICREYPNEFNVECIFKQYPCYKIRADNYYEELLIYGFRTKRFPELQEFSTGKIRHWFKNYFLIPVPKCV